MVLVIAAPAAMAAEAKPVLWWSFDEQSAGTAKDLASGATDTVEGNFRYMPGPSGSAIKPDGYTTCMSRSSRKAPKFDTAITAEAWVAQAAYPWNWCPIIAQVDPQGWGYRLAVGPHGDFSLELSIDGQWQKCISPQKLLPLRKWVHIAGAYDPNDGITLYADGKRVAHLAVTGKPDWAQRATLRAFMNYEKIKPSNLYRAFGTLPGWFSVDGLVDEVKLYDTALSPEQIARDATPKNKVPDPALPRRKMPSGPDKPGRFGAYYCKLKYYPEWDNLWSVDEHPDVVVRFDQSATRVVFWHGSRYSPAWVSENGLWMADQSVEAWNDAEGCYEHMQDPKCLYSHVRIIESSDARVVVHWRYAPVSAHNELWNLNPKTGRALWVDEYYYIYPDQMGIRKPTWQTDRLGRPHQFQESLPFTDPEQTIGEVIDKNFATVANFDGQTGTMRFSKNPTEHKMPPNLTLQRYNFRSKNRPSIIFEPGDRMYHLKDEPMPRDGMNAHGACGHWPVGQMACDGRRAQMADRPTHFLGFPISYPPIHEKDGRSWWNGLYGMTEMSMAELVFAGRSWAFAPKMVVKSNAFKSSGYKLDERAYQLAKTAPSADGKLELTLEASAESPVLNPAFVIRDWRPGKLRLTLDGKAVPRGKDFRYGPRHRLEGEDVIVWIRAKSTKPVKIELTAGPADEN